MIIPAKNPIIEIHDLTVAYQTKPVLWGIDFTLPKGGLIGIIGPNGAGKSTLLKTIMGLNPINSGYIKIFDTSIQKVRQRIGYVPQRESVDWDFPTTVFDVVMMGRYQYMSFFSNKTKDKAIAMHCLAKVGMDALAQRQIGQLSGGQQQRVFLARALAQEADLYFMDEPFAGVDAATEAIIFSLLQKMTKEAGKTIIVVHHDLQSVRHYFDWLVMLNMHLVAVGPTHKVFQPALLQKTYGGKLTLLHEVENLLQKKNINPREHC